MSALTALGSSLARSLKIMARNKVGFAGLIVVLLIVVVALIGPSVVTMDTTANLEEIYLAPSAKHWLGTDYQGRDIFRQMVSGGRDLIFVAALAALLSSLTAITLGSLAALLGGYVDVIVTSVGDLVLTVPRIPLLLVLAGFIRLTSPLSLSLILAAVTWAGLMRQVRAQVLSLKERDYVQAAVQLGLPTSHLLFREILPNMMSYVIISFVLAMTEAIYSQVGLIFLGLVPMTSHNWGVMINLAYNQGAQFGRDSMWYLAVPISMVALLNLALVSMTRSLDELFNPRLRGGH